MAPPQLYSVQYNWTAYSTAVERVRTPGQRAGLTRTAVLAEAWEHLAEGGLPTITMRSLARRLGMSPNPLYSHVEENADLVNDILDEVLA